MHNAGLDKRLRFLCNGAAKEEHEKREQLRAVTTKPMTKEPLL